MTAAVHPRQGRAWQFVPARHSLLGEGDHGGIVQQCQSAVGYGCILRISGRARDNVSIRQKHEFHAVRQSIARGRALFRKGISDTNRKVCDRSGGLCAGPFCVSHLKSACRVKMRDREVSAGQFGCTFQKYVASRRIECAISLMEKKNMNVQEIALKCGFTNDVTFRRTFKMYAGVTPSQYEKGREAE